MTSEFETTAVVSRRGVLDFSGRVTEYYTRSVRSNSMDRRWTRCRPKHGRWAGALGLPRRPVVATGATEESAVAALVARLGAL
jgi:hypothetical protein